MKNLFRLRLAYGLTALLFLWPMIHIGLTKFFSLTSWKLAGWGMYASIEPTYYGFSVWLFGPGAQPLDHLEIGPVFTGGVQVARVSGDKLDVLDFDSTPREDRIEMEKLVRNIRIMPRHSDLETLAALIERMAPPAVARKERALILTFSPRLELSGGYTYTETSAYLVENGRARKLKGPFSTENLTETQVLQKIQQQIGKT